MKLYMKVMYTVEDYSLPIDLIRKLVVKFHLSLIYNT